MKQQATLLATAFDYQTDKKKEKGGSQKKRAPSFKKKKSMHILQKREALKN